MPTNPFGGGGPSKTQINQQNQQIEQQNQILQQQVNDARAFNESVLAQQEAERAAREARIASATRAVNNAFRGSGQRFDRFADTTFDLNQDRLQDNRQDSARELKFALARSGLTGGSVDVDKGQDLDDRFQSGLLEARNFADTEAARLRAQEQQARNNLLGLAASGSVTGADVRGLAQSQVQATNQALQSPPVAPGLGDTFAGLANNIGQALLLSGFRGAGDGVPIGAQDDQFNSFNQPGNKSNEAGTVFNVR